MKKLKSESYRGYNVGFQKDIDGIVYTSIFRRNKLLINDSHGQPSKYEAFEHIKGYIDTHGENLVDIYERMTKEERDKNRVLEEQEDKEIISLIEPIANSHGFTFAESRYFVSRTLVLQYIPKALKYDRPSDRPFIEISMETYAVQRFNFHMPDGMNYNGFGPDQISEFNINNIKFFSDEYMNMIEHAKGVAVSLKNVHVAKKLKLIRTKYRKI